MVLRPSPPAIPGGVDQSPNGRPRHLTSIRNVLSSLIGSTPIKKKMALFFLKTSYSCFYSVIATLNVIEFAIAAANVAMHYIQFSIQFKRTEPLLVMVHFQICVVTFDVSIVPAFRTNRFYFAHFFNPLFTNKKPARLFILGRFHC
jgi:hypothetical protein